MARATQMRARWGPENWARILRGVGGGQGCLGCGSLESALEGPLFFLSQRPGGQQLGSLPIGRLPGSELGLAGALCVCQMLCDVTRVLELRLILRQPSPLWLSFTVEELQVYQQGAKVRDSLSWWPALCQGGPRVAGRAGGGRSRQ